MAFKTRKMLGLQFNFFFANHWNGEWLLVSKKINVNGDLDVN